MNYDTAGAVIIIVIFGLFFGWKQRIDCYLNIQQACAQIEQSYIAK